MERSSCEVRAEFEMSAVITYLSGEDRDHAYRVLDETNEDMKKHSRVYHSIDCYLVRVVADNQVVVLAFPRILFRKEKKLVEYMREWYHRYLNDRAATFTIVDERCEFYNERLFTFEKFFVLYNSAYVE